MCASCKISWGLWFLSANSASVWRVQVAQVGLGPFDLLIYLTWSICNVRLTMFVSLSVSWPPWKLLSLWRSSTYFRSGGKTHYVLRHQQSMNCIAIKPWPWVAMVVTCLSMAIGLKACAHIAPTKFSPLRPSVPLVQDSGNIAIQFSSTDIYRWISMLCANPSIYIYMLYTASAGPNNIGPDCRLRMTLRIKDKEPRDA